ncbi:Sensor histidine kinase RcsC [Methylobacterium crusticola]|uniref:histidine kinase n=1 Tax=Methylobacterium crusticola TaxID=1697972 RepID=A0ABQ4QXX6_9HYPH|nr:hybrid sensor histidine kinase/response regulator [Methylobacterium crusticola]GJD49519.1 Sensor histidine kinase RcsC [Methylobacterium crusticola]
MTETRPAGRGGAASEAAPVRILLLEDSDLDAELVAEFVARIGLPHAIERVMTREGFRAAAASRCHDLILADYVLPTFDGLSALAVAREHCPGIPFVFVSGTLGEDVAVEALKGGATDYVVKQRLDRLPRTIVRALAEARARAERETADQALRALNETLETRIEERTRELAEANTELRRQVAERERVEVALRQAQRLEAVGQLTSGVAHDFNNLLTVISGNIGFLERTVTDATGRRRLDMMRSAAERGARLTAQLLAFSRRQRLDPKPVDLNETVASMRDLLQSSMGGAVRIETVHQRDLWPAMVDPTQIELVILNLAINARDAMEVGGALTIETANVGLGSPRTPEEPQAGEYVMVSVNDTGTGIPPAVLERVFEPFFTTKEVGRGSGLGLAQVYGFAKQSGGGVRIDTQMGQGTSVRVYLPRASAAALGAGLAARADCPVSQQADGHPVVLVVDDDSAVREITATLLAELGYAVREAGSGHAALAALDRDPEIDLMVVDFAMPGMNGAEVAHEARRRRPALPILFVTGYADTAALMQTGQAGADRIVQKPFQDGELGRKVKAALRSGQRPAGPRLVSSREAGS